MVRRRAPDSSRINGTVGKPIVPGNSNCGLHLPGPLRELATACKGGFAYGACSFQLPGGVSQQHHLSLGVRPPTPLPS